MRARPPRLRQRPKRRPKRLQYRSTFPAATSVPARRRTRKQAGTAPAAPEKPAADRRLSRRMRRRRHRLTRRVATSMPSRGRKTQPGRLRQRRASQLVSTPLSRPPTPLPIRMWRQLQRMTPRLRSKRRETPPVPTLPRRLMTAPSPVPSKTWRRRLKRGHRKALQAPTLWRRPTTAPRRRCGYRARSAPLSYAKADDGTARLRGCRATQAEASEDNAGADSMAQVEDGTAPATEDDAAASADVEVAEDDAGADIVAGVRRQHRARYRGRCGGFG